MTDFSGFDPASVRAEAEGRLSRQMLLIYRAFNAIAQEKYAERGYHGLNAAHTSLMANLERGGIRIVDLADRMGITKQFAGRLVQELVKIAFVTSVSDPHDRRATLVQGTPAGWQYLLDACQVQAEIDDIFRNMLGEERCADFIISIEQLARLGSHAGKPGEPLELLLGQDE